MHATADRLDFAPPPQPGLLRGFGLAVLAHLLLLFALMHGLQWKRETQTAVAEAELWSALPQQAAPREAVQPPPPPPPPAPVVQAPPPPPPVVKAPPQPEPPVQRQPDIALEREKQKRELEKRELEKRERELEKRELEKQKQAELREREQRKKAEAQKKQREEEVARKKEEQARQVAEAKRKEEAEKRKEQEAREATRMAKQREENLRRIQGMADKGAPEATAARSSGPSASWGARVQARVKPNIVFSDDAPGNPEAVVEVRLAPDGTIVSRRIKKGSGNRAWDEAVLRALDRTEVLPRDTDGRVPPGGDLVFRPRG